MPGNPHRIGGIINHEQPLALPAVACERHLYRCVRTGLGYKEIMAWLARHNLFTSQEHDMREIDPEITKHFEELAETLRESIDAFPWEEEVVWIAKKYSLSEEQTTVLKTIGAKSLVLMISPPDLHVEIEKQLKLDGPEVAAITQDFIERVFLPVTDDGDAPVYVGQTTTVTKKHFKCLDDGTEKTWVLDDIEVVAPFRSGGISGAIGGVLFMGLIGLISLTGIIAMNPCTVVAGLLGVVIAGFGMRWQLRGDWHVTIGFTDGTTKGISSRTRQDAYELAAAILSAKAAK